MTDIRRLREILAAAKSYFESTADEVDTQEAWEMALNAYFKGNALSRLIFHKRLAVAARLGDCNTGATVLDFGCGPGIFSAWLAATARSVTAVDINTSLASGFLSHLGVENTSVRTPNILESRELAFDTVYALDVLEHIEDLKPVIDSLTASLRLGGSLVLSGPTENLFYRLGRRLVRFPGDYHYWSVKQVEAALVESGLRAVERVVLPLPGPWALFDIVRLEREPNRLFWGRS